MQFQWLLSMALSGDWLKFDNSLHVKTRDSMGWTITDGCFTEYHALSDALSLRLVPNGGKRLPTQ